MSPSRDTACASIVAPARSCEADRIQARRFGRLTDDERRQIELAENVERLDFDDYEASRQRLAEIRAAEEEARREAEVSGPSRARNSGPKGGRPKGATPGSQRDVAARTGLSRTEVQRIERHVEAAERYPVAARVAGR